MLVSFVGVYVWIGVSHRRYFFGKKEEEKKRKAKKSHEKENTLGLLLEVWRYCVCVCVCNLCAPVSFSFFFNLFASEWKKNWIFCHGKKDFNAFYLVKNLYCIENRHHPHLNHCIFVTGIERKKLCGHPLKRTHARKKIWCLLRINTHMYKWCSSVGFFFSSVNLKDIFISFSLPRPILPTHTHTIHHLKFKLKSM